MQDAGKERRPAKEAQQPLYGQHQDNQFKQESLLITTILLISVSMASIRGYGQIRKGHILERGEYLSVDDEQNACDQRTDTSHDTQQPTKADTEKA
jgi:hypothetical protein